MEATVSALKRLTLWHSQGSSSLYFHTFSLGSEHKTKKKLVKQSLVHRCVTL